MTTKKSFTTTAYTNVDDLVFGQSLYPVTTKRGLEVGKGQVYPEVNFTLPPMLIEEESMPKVIDIYKEIMTGVSQRAVDLSVPGFVAEFEWLPAMSFNPDFGLQVTQVLEDIAEDFFQKYGTKIAVRSTPVDIREGKTVMNMWHGEAWDKVMRTFQGSADIGSDLLAIESVGGKDVHDEGLMYCDVEKIIFALGVLGCRDMEQLWGAICDIADKSKFSIASGDTACGFANTAMVLADRHMIPKSLSAVSRACSAVRTMVANEMGAIGPDKDCGYEGVVIKAITGMPVTMEGRSAACAHLSNVGNVAACVADLWSNESVQHVKLLSGFTDVISMEQLTYDCRLMNEATKRGPEAALLLRDLHADSDSSLDPQAYILRPDIAMKLAQGIVSTENSHYLRTKGVATLTLDLITEGHDKGELVLDDRELTYIDMMSETIANMTNDEDELIDKMISENTNAKFRPEMYDLGETAEAQRNAA